MATILFDGVVHPRGHRLSLSGPIQAVHKHGADNLDVVVRVQIQNSIISISCESKQDAQAFYPFAARAARELAQHAVDLFSFLDGHPRIALINTVKVAFGAPALFDIPFDENFSLTTSYNGALMGRAAEIIISDLAIANAMRDLIACLSNMSAIPHTCGRVIEAIRRATINTQEPLPLKNSKNDRTLEWRLMQSLLNISRKYQEDISDLSIEPRHGGFLYGDDAPVIDILKRTWIIMDRYIHFRMRENVTFPVDEFPILE